MITAHRFAVLSCVFPPEPVVSAHTSARIAEQLVADGHPVLVITSFPSRPGGRMHPGFRRLLGDRTRTAAGFDLLRCFSFPSSASSLISRWLENVSFGMTSALAVLLTPRLGVVYANTWPIFAQGLVSLACRLRGIPLVLSVQDVYPESLVAQNRVRSEGSLIFRLLRWMDAATTRNSKALIVISARFRQFYLHERSLPPERVHTVPNWVDEHELIADPPDNPVRAEHGIPEDAFLAVYAGNVGVAAGVDVLLRSYAHMLERLDIYLLVAGAGSEFGNCQKLARETRNSRILFRRPWARADTSTVLGAADLCLVSTQGRQSLVSVPSKLISYMLAGRPVAALALPDSEIAAILTESGCGWVTPPGDPQKLSKLITEIAGLPRSERTRRGKAGRDFALAHYSQDVNLRKIITVLENAAG
jgi:putative colanic acid biosynthesis glycosyltransferase WcaI